MARDIANIENEFDMMRRQMDNLLDSFSGSIDGFSLFNNKSQAPKGFRNPVMDFYETEKELIAKIEIPGVKKEDIKLEIKNNTLTLRAENKIEKENKDEKSGYYKIERGYTRYMRSLPLPENIDESKVKAKYKDGLLEVHIPKKETISSEKGKFITIE